MATVSEIVREVLAAFKAERDNPSRDLSSIVPSGAALTFETLQAHGFRLGQTRRPRVIERTRRFLVSRLEILSGDGQQAAVGQPVPDPIHIRAVSVAAQPLARVRLRVAVRGGGELDLTAIETRAITIGSKQEVVATIEGNSWRLGDEGPNELHVSAAGAEVVVRADVTRPGPTARKTTGPNP